MTMTTVTHEDFPVYNCINDLVRGYRNGYYNSNNQTFEESKIYKHVLSIDISKDTIEIPILFRRTIAEDFFRNVADIGSSNKTKVLISLYTTIPSQERRTSRTILNQFFSIMSDGSRLVKITTSKGNVYYGGKGIILDDDFKPLILLTIKTEKSDTVNFIKYTRFICHVSPRIFEKQDEMFVKYIIKKVFPVLAKYEFDFPTDSFSEPGDNARFKIVIDDFDEIFFISPVQPKPEDIEKDTFNQVLVDNVDEIIAEISN